MILLPELSEALEFPLFWSLQVFLGETGKGLMAQPSYPNIRAWNVQRSFHALGFYLP